MKEWLELLLNDLSPQGRKRFIRVAWQMFVFFHILWACGFLATYGLIGFASASDVERLEEQQKNLRSDQKQDRVERIEDRIFDLRLEQCRSMRGGGSGLPYSKQIADQLMRHQQFTNTNYPLIDCKEL